MAMPEELTDGNLKPNIHRPSSAALPHHQLLLLLLQFSGCLIRLAFRMPKAFTKHEIQCIE